MMAMRRIILDCIKSRSKQYESFFGGELTASGFTRDAVRPKNLYIVFYFSFEKGGELWDSFGETLARILPYFFEVQTLVSSMFD
jgi:hypothetical protein